MDGVVDEGLEVGNTDGLALVGVADGILDGLLEGENVCSAVGSKEGCIEG